MLKRLRKFVKNNLDSLKATAMIIAGVLGFFYGVSILENAHLAIIRYSGRNVVTLLNSGGGGGTGFIVKGKSGKRYIMTNNHICDSADDKPLIAIYQGTRYIVDGMKRYKLNDLCALLAPTPIDSNFSIASSVDLHERVFSIGHPLLEPLTITQGELSSRVYVQISTGINVDPKDCAGETYTLEDLSDSPLALIFGIRNVCIRTLESNGSTVNILPGNSGSPTVNIYGNVVGVVFAAVESGVHSYHVPLSHLSKFIEEL